MVNVSHKYLVSFVIPTMNNHNELERTLNSLAGALKCGCEAIVVDSGETSISESQLREWNIKSEDILVIHSLPKGIYSAINQGITFATGEWLVVMTAGDGLLPDAEKTILSNLSDKNKILVFDQEVRDSQCRPVYTFKSTGTSLWPTQSVVINRHVFNHLGCFDTTFSSISDQLFFWQARKKFKFEVISHSVSYFCLGGLSSSISIKLLKEEFFLDRYLGKGAVNSSFSVLRTIIKKIVEKIFGENLMIFLKRWLLRYSK